MGIRIVAAAVAAALAAGALWWFANAKPAAPKLAAVGGAFDLPGGAKVELPSGTGFGAALDLFQLLEAGKPADTNFGFGFDADGAPNADALELARTCGKLLAGFPKMTVSVNAFHKPDDEAAKARLGKALAAFHKEYVAAGGPADRFVAEAGPPCDRNERPGYMTLAALPLGQKRPERVPLPKGVEVDPNPPAGDNMPGGGPPVRGAPLKGAPGKGAGKSPPKSA